ncbi:DUF4381 family protein [Vibrio mediterranei]|uniref:DUF4381 domain-containing protein n=1 Tax=Vibrio mediterranei TaxID=689 RepID=A0A3G4VHS3_9VIBR|nr:DUF4381 family protein [Vibrio mediterranei]AYV24343.1 DUF4381 domain-containing protein [Vibrio mediterranei]MCY9853507.1 DUF4381 family protein [Vibrio mediterranei]
MTQPAPSSYILRNMLEVPNPDSVSWLPQTIGWQLIGLLIVLLIGVKLFRGYCRHSMLRYRREALDILQSNKTSKQRDQMCYDVLKSVTQYLKISQSQQYGTAWIEQLNRYVSPDAQFNVELGGKWLRTLLSSKVTLDASESEHIYQQVHRWIEHHPVPNWLKQYWQAKQVIARSLSRMGIQGGQR